jgi:hypothetical protein
MDHNNIIVEIDKAVAEIENYIQKYKIPKDSSLETGSIKVLKLLKIELLKGDTIVNERVLRAFKDICTSTAIQFEDTSFYAPIFFIHDELKKLIPSFERLELLRKDFGKGNPI